jgi:uncharacterized membrane protein
MGRFQFASLGFPQFVVLALVALVLWFYLNRKRDSK